MYGMWNKSCNECIDCSYVENCELCYEVLNAKNCYGCLFGENLQQCNDCLFSRDLVGCSNCFGWLSDANGTAKSAVAEPGKLLTLRNEI